MPDESPIFGGSIPPEVGSSPPPLPPRLGHVERLLRWYLGRAGSYSSRRFIIEMAVLSFVLKIAFTLPFALLISDLGESNTDRMLDELPPEAIAIVALGLAPVFETLIFQWFLPWICSLFTSRWVWRIGLPSAVFAVAHIPSAGVHALSVLLPGIVFTLGFAAKRQSSRWTALWTTSVVHALHNAIAFSLVIAARGMGL